MIDIYDIAYIVKSVIENDATYRPFFDILKTDKNISWEIDDAPCTMIDDMAYHTDN